MLEFGVWNLEFGIWSLEFGVLEQSFMGESPPASVLIR